MSEERHRSGSWWCQQSFINSWFRGGVTGEERDFIWHDRREESTCTAEMVYQYWWSFLLHCTTPPLMTENMLTYRYRVIRKYVPLALQAIKCNTKHLPAKLFVSHSFYREAMFLIFAGKHQISKLCFSTVMHLPLKMTTFISAITLYLLILHHVTGWWIDWYSI